VIRPKDFVDSSEEEGGEKAVAAEARERELELAA
jgi:hypothetical protein